MKNNHTRVISGNVIITNPSDWKNESLLFEPNGSITIETSMTLILNNLYARDKEQGKINIRVIGAHGKNGVNGANGINSQTGQGGNGQPGTAGFIGSMMPQVQINANQVIGNLHLSAGGGNGGNGGAGGHGGNGTYAGGNGGNGGAGGNAGNGSTFNFVFKELSGEVITAIIGSQGGAGGYGGLGGDGTKKGLNGKHGYSGAAGTPPIISVNRK